MVEQADVARRDSPRRFEQRIARHPRYAKYSSPRKVVRAIRRPELGTLSEGAGADIAVLQVEKGRFGFLDSGHAKLDGDRRVDCVLTIRNGVIVWDSDGLSLPDWIKAGPYTNFK